MSSKIAIGVNTFKTDVNRFKVANQSYERLSTLDDVDVYDIQKPGIKGTFNTIDKLQRTAKDVIKGYQKDLPFVNDLFNIMADIDCDYFIVTNADIMISNRLIKHIREQEITALPCQRLDVKPINHISESLIPLKWEIAGFDVFCFNTNWYRKHSWLFEDYIQGKPVYDHVYAGLMKVFGNNDIIVNKNPAMCVHEHHGNASHIKDAAVEFNNEAREKSKLKQFNFVWDDYFAKVLLPGRGIQEPRYRFLHEIKNEAAVERDFFAKRIAGIQNLIDDEKNRH